MRRLFLLLAFFSNCALAHFGDRPVLSDPSRPEGEADSDFDLAEYHDADVPEGFREFADRICRYNRRMRCQEVNPAAAGPQASIQYVHLDEPHRTLVRVTVTDWEIGMQKAAELGINFRLFAKKETVEDLDKQIGEAQRMRRYCKEGKELCLIMATLASSVSRDWAMAGIIACSVADSSCETAIEKQTKELERKKKELEEKDKEKETQKEKEGGSTGGTGSGTDGGGSREAEGHSSIPADRPGRRGTVTIIDHPDRTGFGCSHIRCFPL